MVFPGIVGGFNHLISCWASGMNHSWLFVRVRYLSVDRNRVSSFPERINAFIRYVCNDEWTKVVTWTTWVWLVRLKVHMIWAEDWEVDSTTYIFERRASCDDRKMGFTFSHRLFCFLSVLYVIEFMCITNGNPNRIYPSWLEGSVWIPRLLGIFGLKLWPGSTSSVS